MAGFFVSLATATRRLTTENVSLRAPFTIVLALRSAYLVVRQDEVLESNPSVRFVLGLSEILSECFGNTRQ